MNDKNDSKWSMYILVSGFAFETLAIIALGFLAGYYLDKWLHTNVVFQVVLMILAVFYAIFMFIHRVQKLEGKHERE